MPQVIVHAVEGRTPEQKRALMSDITDAVAKHFNVPISGVIVTILETPLEDKMAGGVLYSERKAAAAAAAAKAAE